MEASHHIHRLRCRIRIADGDAAFPLRTRVREIMYPEWLAELERAFRETTTEAGSIHIPVLNLDLRVDALDDVAPALSRLAREEIRALSFTTPSAARARDLAAFLEYLRTGALPWHVAASPREEVLARISRAAGRVDAVAADVPADLSAAFDYFMRWLPLLAERRWIEVAQGLDAGHADAAIGLTLRDLADYGALPSDFHGRVQATSAVLAFAHTRRTSLPQLRSDHAHRGTMLLARVLGLAAPAPEQLPSFLERLPQPLRSWLSERHSENTAATPRRAERPSPQPIRRSPPGVQGSPLLEPNSVVLPPQHGGATARSGGPFGVTLADAGLVLLHPFLSRLFSKTGVLSSDATRILPSETSRAAALLRFAVSGEDDAYEFDLALVKVLLGLAPDSPLPVSPGLLRPSERDEVSELLASVIEHWRSLGKSSVASLRASFLQRNGVLEEIGTAWKLHVEGRAFDLLLSRLPWGLGTVKLSWMRGPVFVEWNTH